MHRALTIVATTGLILVAGAAPALGAAIHPRSMPLLNAASQDSGCDVTVQVTPNNGPADEPFFGSTGWVDATARLTCTHGWRVMKIGARITVVDDDGSRGVRISKGYEVKYTATTPSTQPVDVGIIDRDNPCLLKSDGALHPPGTSTLPWLMPLGSHQLIYGYWAVVNAVPADGHPYRSKVAEFGFSFTCTTARDPFA